MEDLFSPNSLATFHGLNQRSFKEKRAASHGVAWKIRCSKRLNKMRGFSKQMAGAEQRIFNSRGNYLKENVFVAAKAVENTSRNSPSIETEGT